MKKKDDFNEVDSGSFTKGDNEFDYIIEQKDSLDPMQEGNMRVRVIRKTPVVESVRTRYEPHVEVTGTADCYVPAIWGYDLKAIKKTLYLIPGLFLFGTAMILMPNLVSNLISSIGTKITLSDTATIIIRYICYGLIGVLAMYGLIIPLWATWFRQLKSYLYLKKNARPYTEREALYNEIVNQHQGKSN